MQSALIAPRSEAHPAESSYVVLIADRHVSVRRGRRHHHVELIKSRPDQAGVQNRRGSPPIWIAGTDGRLPECIFDPGAIGGVTGPKPFA